MDGPMTLSAKILAAHGVDDLTPGAFALARIDRVMLNDVSGAVSIHEFEKMGASGVFDPARVACVVDHFWPAKDARSAALVARLRTFAERQGITDYWEVGATRDAGIEHAILAERGRIMPGDLLVGADSHTCTSGAFGAFATGMGSSDIAAAMALGEVWLKVPEVIEVEFTGSPGEHVTGKDLILAYIAAGRRRRCELRRAGVLRRGRRRALARRAPRALQHGGRGGGEDRDGGAPTRRRCEWLAERVPEAEPAALAADPGAPYDRRTSIDLDGMRPLVAAPSSPGNVHPIDELAGTVKIDQVYVGNCSNGTMTDLRQLAEMLRGNQVAPGVRLIVVPATQRIYREALQEGLIEVFLDAGAMMSAPTCGACFGGHTGILAAGEVAVTTTNRNFRGRMGDPESSVYLANAYVAGAAAVAGDLVDPADVR